ncbi:MAG: alanine:cation symporter family protein [Bdellovibrionales bacterium]|nr:alanine:cation symporter family protein [Bdellovibrionales bacterium]
MNGFFTTVLSFWQIISLLIAQVVDVVWGLPLVILLVGGGSILFVYAGFLPFRGFIHAFKLMLGLYHHPGESKADGQLSHFQALTNAIAATIGLGNIAGVAVAISQGGAGAVFWMWVSAFIGMNTKCFECTLSLMYRGRDYKGEVHGGPMYVIQQAMPKQLKFLAYVFAICGLIGCMALFQTNQLAHYAQEQIGCPPLLIGLLGAGFVLIVMKGGIERLGHVTGAMVPVMTVIYVVSCLIILVLNFDKVPETIMLIFKEAFSGRAAGGGVAGYAVAEVMKVGVKRAAFSNEAGVGTAPMAHSNVRTNEPASEGLVAMLEPFLDTIVVCTMTALVILIGLPSGQGSAEEGILLTRLAFDNSLGVAGPWLLGAAIFLFSTTTMLGMANYNLKCWNFLFRGRWGLGENVFYVYFCGTLILASVAEITDVVNILDIGYGLMAYPNMLAVLMLAPKVKKTIKEYIEKYQI